MPLTIELTSSNILTLSRLSYVRSKNANSSACIHGKLALKWLAASAYPATADSVFEPVSVGSDAVEAILNSVYSLNPSNNAIILFDAARFEGSMFVLATILFPAVLITGTLVIKLNINDDICVIYSLTCL